MQFRRRKLSIDQMEKMVSHNAKRNFPPISRSEFQVGDSKLAVVAKMTGRGYEVFYLYILNDQPVDRRTAQAACA